MRMCLILFDLSVYNKEIPQVPGTINGAIYKPRRQYISISLQISVKSRGVKVGHFLNPVMTTCANGKLQSSGGCLPVDGTSG